MDVGASHWVARIYTCKEGEALPRPYNRFNLQDLVGSFGTRFIALQ